MRQNEHVIGQLVKQKQLSQSRYWSDKPQNLSKWKTEFKDRLDIGFSTIHAAKGLEGDDVFLVNLRGGRMGFPSEIEDDPLLQLAMPTSEAHPHAEELRLFYVALTRAKEMTILYTHSERESEFLIELQRDGENGNFQLRPQHPRGNEPAATDRENDSGGGKYTKWYLPR